MNRRMEIVRILLKIAMWVLIIGFGCNFVMQTISYSFYKNAKQMKDLLFQPKFIQFNQDLSGYGVNLDADSAEIILYFGGSNYIAYNSVGKLGGNYGCPFISADYYGSQNSKGKMNLSSMQKTATDLYDWAKENYPNKKIVIMGHSYGAGMATYLASVKECNELILLAAYGDLSDLYNKFIPIFWGPSKIFISNNIQSREYAKKVNCPTYVIGSKSDKTLSAELQQKVVGYFNQSEVTIYEDIKHEKYLLDKRVIKQIKDTIQNN